MLDIIYYSQANQDRWVCEILNFKKNGYFVDIGAYDGIQTSNTYTFEKFLNWNGICVEANHSIYNKLIKNRNCTNVFAAVSNNNGVCNFGDDKINTGNNLVNCYLLEKILIDNNSPKEIDYLSIDVEGHEYDIFKSFNFNNWDIKLITVEHNLYCDGDFNKNRLFELLISNGFTRIVDNAICLDENPDYYHKPYEDWYINNKYLNLELKKQHIK